MIAPGKIPAAPVAATAPVAGVLVSSPQRQAQTPALPVSGALPPVNTSRSLGSQDLRSATADGQIVLPWETLVPMTGLVVPLSPQKRLFRRGWFYGISGFAVTGVPVANTYVVNMGNNERYLPWVIAQYTTTFGVLLEAPTGNQDARQHFYDLSKIFALGATGDAIFYSVE